jgi:sulfonate transport system substrate-binding protein
MTAGASRGARLVCVGLVALTAVACHRHRRQGTTPKEAGEVLELAVGYQRSSWAFLLLRRQGQLEARLKPLGVKVKWLEFSAGPAIMEGINVGSVDVALVGDAPPIFAQAGGFKFAYAAVEPPKPQAAAIIVPAESPITSVGGLKGHKVGVQKGSSAHHLLIESLAAAGLSWNDIQPVYLSPPDARAAFERGGIDAWAIWDPHFAAAELQLRARPIDNPQKSFRYYQFLVVRPELPVVRPAVYAQVMVALAEAERLIQDRPAEVAAQLAADARIAPEILERALARGKFGVQPITAEVWTEQQALADAFADLRLIKKIPDVRTAALGSVPVEASEQTVQLSW